MPPESSEILEFDPLDTLSPEDNRRFTDAELCDLLESIRADGQQTPGIVCPHPSVPGKLLCIAGNRRKRCCEILDIPFRAQRLDHPVSRAEMVKIRFNENYHRKNPSPFDLCQDLSAYMQERGISQAEAAGELHLSRPTLSRITSVRRYPPELRPLAEKLCPSVCWIIASLPPSVMKQALEYASTPGADGKLPTRDQVGRLAAQLEGKGKRTKARRIAILVNRRLITVQVHEEDTPDSVIEETKEALAQLARHRQLPLEAIVAVFGESGKDKPAA